MKTLPDLIKHIDRLNKDIQKLNIALFVCKTQRNSGYSAWVCGDNWNGSVHDWIRDNNLELNKILED